MHQRAWVVLFLVLVETAAGSESELKGTTGSDAGRTKVPGAAPLRPPMTAARHNPFAPRVPLPATPQTPAAPPPLAPVTLSEPVVQHPAFHFLMRYRDADDHVAVYLEKGSDILRAEPGKRLDRTYKVERIEATQVVIVNTETNVEVQIPIASGSPN